MEDLFREIIGPDSNAINWWQMSIRGIIIFSFTLLLIRFGDNRIFGKSAAFDIALGVILGSVLSRGITGNAPFVPVLVSSFVLVFMHRFLAHLACRSSIGNFIKGKSYQLIKNGELLHDQMNHNRITQKDLEEAMRENGKINNLKEVEAAFLERNGNISIINKKG
ncbi:hypothetical protein AAE02nite_05030 [Adhaeribacter aerolatus]|uniref:YetF C-terminal domain-containing protein n=1 Tax=Adhaeribacter aerolatus TaxID=670289 RepID=A0A512ASZ8_9BACT|nr:YetF domain-containing protein [Adhaeribacter aerolatus]GEO02839.1 hypothetical protein AAE02nite_05030 [Adhaeribacter aerolatus]